MENQNKVMTRAEKKDAVKALIKGLLTNKQYKASDLIDEAAKLYTATYGGEENENANDVKGRIGSVLDVMKKEEDVRFEDGKYALKAETPIQEQQPAPKRRTRKTTAKKQEETPVAEETVEEQKKEEKEEKAKKPAAKRTAAKKKATPLPPAPLQPIAPVDPTTPEAQPTPAPKKRARKTAKKVEEVEATIEQPLAPAKENEVETPVQEEVPVAVETVATPVAKQEESKAETAVATPVVMDMSFLFGEVKPSKKTEKKPQEEKKPAVKTEEKPVQKQEKQEKPAPKKQESKTEKKPTVTEKKPAAKRTAKAATTELSADEKLQEKFLQKLRKLGGNYFEYYAVYLLEKYSRLCGRRLEGLKISGGTNDGGIDGELELCDRFGLKETIYIQAKNWDPSKGDEKKWVVGETLLQQFIGACVCKQAQAGKQNCRGIFITTSRFTPEAKRILENLGEKFVGYDGADLYETAKECGFGIVKKGEEWQIDEHLLSGEKAFFQMLP